MSPFNILFVCLGNICRSPMAEVLLRAALDAASPRRETRVGSAGFLPGGKPASHPAEVVMRERDLDLSCHLSTQITAALAEQQDLILTMEEEQAEEIRQWGLTTPVESFRSYASRGADTGNVLDPYGESPDTYRRVAEFIAERIPSIIERLREDGVV